MKAFLLAAGFGTRLYSVMNSVPKCLAPIRGRPLLDIWLELLSVAGIGQVLVNTHYLAPQVHEFAARWRGLPEITVTYEPSLLGSAGTIARNWNFVDGDESFLVCYADSLTDLDIQGFLDFHARHAGLVSTVLFRPEDPCECGVVELGDAGEMLSFEEKPEIPKSPFACGGIYAMRSGIRPLLPGTVPADIGRDLMPRCLHVSYGWIWGGLLVDIGTPSNYAKAQRAWAEKGRNRPRVSR